MHTPTTGTAARRAGVGALIALVLAGALYVSVGHDGSGVARQSRATRPSHAIAAPGDASAGPSAPSSVAPAHPALRPPPALLVSAPAKLASAWQVLARVHGRAAAWVAERDGATLMRLDQASLRLHLHAGSSDGGTAGWRYGDRVSASEIHSLVAGFNGGFKLTYHDVGFSAGGHVAVALKSGLGSIVTYTDGRTDVGAWRAGIPAPRRPVFSVLQNQHLLLDGGRAAASAAGCGEPCWGETLGGVARPARSGLGVDAAGRLVWAGGEHLSAAGLARALLAGHAVRAVELDINPYWVAGYVYPHHRTGPSAVPLVPGQHGIAGMLLEADARDFLTVVAVR